ncbi:HD domain-containing protein [Acetobacterium paludosum]|uniref:HD domain-containing protein n=1 Tax=Acetobacterium paludosum TaxID=52693 RepID=A0A923HV27_9FIRM|nr:HD domain-containing phosphohydrolase [Acetobacterium paludosum]MBC3887124.1 HD domain-containing protein [Acetobacterium paludosum]
MSIYLSNMERTILAILNNVFINLPVEIQKHSILVSHYSMELYRKALFLNYTDGIAPLKAERIPYIGWATLYHDIGKLTSSYQLSNRTFSFYNANFSIHDNHQIKGFHLLLEILINQNLEFETTPLFIFLKDVILNHHEWWDGSGQPQAKKRNEIPLIARICSIADVYEYINNMQTNDFNISCNKSCDIIENESGKRFDPALVDIFLDFSINPDALNALTKEE